MTTYVSTVLDRINDLMIAWDKAHPWTVGHNVSLPDTLIMSTDVRDEIRNLSGQIAHVPVKPSLGSNPTFYDLHLRVDPSLPDGSLYVAKTLSQP